MIGSLERSASVSSVTRRTSSVRSSCGCRDRKPRSPSANSGQNAFQKLIDDWKFGEIGFGVVGDAKDEQRAVVVRLPRSEAALPLGKLRAKRIPKINR